MLEVIQNKKKKIHQRCIKLIKSDNKDISYGVTKDLLCFK